MKIAASLDGRTALANGVSQWITADEARADGHRWRARACAVLTGIGTVKQDDPELTVRAVATPRQPLRVLVDAKLEVPLEAKLLRGGNVLIAAAVDNADKIAALQALGVETVVLPNAAGKVELSHLLRELAARELNELHVEAGFKLNGSLLREGLVDELLVYLAPSVIGDAGAGMFHLAPLASLAERSQWRFHDLRQIGEDVRILARRAGGSTSHPA